jgi:exopolysaccharide biosynthesis polyprenyl glycosylphosphotransferase
MVSGLHSWAPRPEYFILALSVTILAQEASVIGAATLTESIQHHRVFDGITLPVLMGLVTLLILWTVQNLSGGYNAALTRRQIAAQVKVDLCTAGYVVVFLGVVGTETVEVAFVSLMTILAVPCRLAARSLTLRIAYPLGLRTKKRVVIVGSGQIAHLYAASLLKYEAASTEVVGFIDTPDRPDRRCEILGLPVYPLNDLERLITACRVNHVVFAFSLLPDSALVKVLGTCRSHASVVIGLVPRFYEAMTTNTQLIEEHGIPVLTLSSRAGRWDDLARSAFERMLAALGLLVTLPLLVMAAVAVRLDGPGPVFFRQQRVGYEGRLFTIYKLRSMRKPKPGESVDSPARYTRVGAFLRKSSIDELPQLWNVLRGDMSLVGPRPERPEYVERFQKQIPNYDKRHQVRGGLTGLAQIKGLRGATSIVERTRLDIFYVQHRTIWLDMKIVLLTFTALIPSSQGIGGESMFLDLVSEVAKHRTPGEPTVPTNAAQYLALEIQRTGLDLKAGEHTKGKLEQDGIESDIVVAKA